MSEILLSAALIVRDEAAYLDDCLASLAGITDEVVVVDTGSRDATREIAVRRGARVADFVWCDDFAAARNHALGLARGRWILYIDADERIRCDDAAALRAMLDDPRFVGLLVLFHVHPDATPYHDIRLFRNDPSVRFEGVIHETVWPSIRRHLMAGNGEVGVSNVELVHLGYIGDPRHKVGRNLPLLERAVEADPGRIYLWCELGKAYDLIERHDDADRAFARALAAVRADEEPNPADAVAYTDTIGWRLRGGLTPDALLDEGLGRFPTNKQLLWIRSCRLMERGDFQTAMGVIGRVLGEREPPGIDMTHGYDRRIFGVFGFQAMATCCFKLGHYADASSYFAQALEQEPDNGALRRQAEMADRLARAAAGAAPPPCD